MNTENIPGSEVTFNGLSFTDYTGRLFEWNGGLYRAIPVERVSFCQDLFNKGVMQDLIKQKLFVETKITSLKLDPYGIVLKHRLIPFVSYPQEWCDTMLKDAALLHLDFCLELDRHNLISADASPLNILFDGCQPIFVDFGSIDPLPVDISSWPWSGYEPFCQFFIHPLRLMAQGHGRIARWLLHDYEKGVLKSDVEALFHRPLLGSNLARGAVNWLQSAAWRNMPLAIQPTAKKVHALGRRILLRPLGLPQSRQAFLEKIRQEVASINLPSVKTEVSSSNNGSLPLFSPLENWSTKHQIVHNVLSDLRPNSVLDVGSGTYEGSFSMLAARCGSQVVSFDPDEASINRLYAEAKKNNLPILPLLMDCISPSYDLSNDWFTPSSERLQCDLVLALNLVDRLVFSANIRFDRIVKRLSDFSGRWLLVEFIPREAPYIPTWSAEKVSMFSWYTLETFMDALRTSFCSINIIPSHPSPRVLLLCEK